MVLRKMLLHVLRVGSLRYLQGFGNFDNDELTLFKHVLGSSNTSQAG